MNSSASSHESRRRPRGNSMEASADEPYPANLLQTRYATFSLSSRLSAISFQRIAAAARIELLIRVGCFYVRGPTIYRRGVRFRGAASLVGGN